MTGDMEVARLTVLKGLSIRQTHGFCHFCPVKSEAIPTQQKKQPQTQYQDVLKIRNINTLFSGSAFCKSCLRSKP